MFSIRMLHSCRRYDLYWFMSITLGVPPLSTVKLSKYYLWNGNRNRIPRTMPLTHILSMNGLVSQFLPIYHNSKQSVMHCSYTHLIVTENTSRESYLQEYNIIAYTRMTRRLCLIHNLINNALFWSNLHKPRRTSHHSHTYIKAKMHKTPRRRHVTVLRNITLPQVLSNNLHKLY